MIARPVHQPRSRSKSSLLGFCGCLLTGSLLAVAASAAEPGVSLPTDIQWPQFRGPHHNALAPHADPPIRWSETENVVWKRPTEYRGWSSPVVWGPTAWLTEATPDGTRMFAMAVDLATGKWLWRRQLFETRPDQVRDIHSMNSYASPTPVTDGQRVWVTFGSYGTACLEAATGKTIWERTDLPCDHHRGPGSSPMLWRDKLFLHYDGFDEQYLVAFEARTGKTLWKRDRDIDYGTDDGDQMKAYCTPIVIEAGGRTQLISPTAKAVLALDPETGEEFWRVRFKEHSATAQPSFDGKHLYVDTGFGKAKLLAIDPTGRGDVTDSHVVWTQPKSIGSKPSPLLHEGLIYNVHDSGIATCIDTADGRIVWTERLGGKYSASPVFAGGRIYWFDHEGTSHVTLPGRTFQRLAENRLEDGCMACPVPIGDYLLVRTRSALYLLGP